MKLFCTISTAALFLCGCSSIGSIGGSKCGSPVPVALNARKKIPDNFFQAKPSGSGELIGTVDLDLALLTDIAFSNSPETRRAWNLAGLAAAQRGRGLSTVLPTVTISGGATRQRSVNVANLDADGTYITAVSEPALHIGYTILTFGATRAVAAAWQNLIGAQLIYNRSLQTLLYRVQVAYFALDSAMASLEAREANLCDAIELQNFEEVRVCSGLGNRQALLRARANTLQARGLVESARANVEGARAALAEVVGVRVSSDFRVVRSKLPANVEAVGGDVDAMVAKALSSRQDLLGSYAQWWSAEYLEQTAKCSMFPRLVISADGANTNYVHRGHGKTFTASAALSWDVFSGFDKFSRVMEQRAQRRIAGENLRSAGLKAAGEVWSQYHGHKSAHKQLISGRALLEAAKESFSAAELAYRNGLCSFTDVLGAQSALAAAREGLVAAENAFSTSLAALAYAVGDLGVIDGS
ncbi:MAG: TolC family protein [Puniceicoccales bacterium]|jgi:outer membrane protein TolC|nr:TolC family protein [Puniceicoccales bacterium]